MNTKIKKRWVKALRSGKYGQAQEVLFDGEKNFCCLGVLCDIEGMGDWVKDEPSLSWIFKPDDRSLGESDAGELPPWFLANVGLTSREQDQLIELNDTYGNDFNQIANWIEANL